VQEASSTKFKAKYGEEPDDFNAVAYDTIILLAAVIDKSGPIARRSATAWPRSRTCRA
jgi:ABC-type branched-subunit amino acid transport system substrate-binding protein